MGQIELNYVLILRWIPWNRTVLHLNCVLMLNWIVWNGTIFDIETVYIGLTKLFEIELFDITE